MCYYNHNKSNLNTKMDRVLVAWRVLFNRRITSSTPTSATFHNIILIKICSCFNPVQPNTRPSHRF